MKRGIAALVAFALIVGILSACMHSEEKEMKKEEQRPQGSLLDFSLGLLQEENTEQNTVLSPLSVYYCLSLAANAAGGDTKQQLEWTLGGSVDQLDENCKALSEVLTDVGGSTTLEIVSGVFTDEAFAINEAYRNDVTKFLDAEILSVPLASGEGLKAINDWASEKTHGEITDLLKQAPAGPAVLLNAIYLNATWQTQFRSKNTADGIFHLLNGEESIASFMAKADSEETYLTAPGVEGVALPYDDGKLSFIALLPEDYAAFVSSLDSERWNELLASKQQVLMNLRLPRFSVEQETELNPMLQRLGICDLFSPVSADLRRLCESEDAAIYVDRAFQKAKIEVGEEGTVAAAVTAMTTKSMAKISRAEISLNFDRPFVYAVIDNATGTPIFLGTVTNP